MAKGCSRERMIELNKKAVIVQKEQGIITAYEKQKIKDERTRLRKEKVAMILKEKELLSKPYEEVIEQNEEIIEQNEEVIEPEVIEPQKIKKEKKKKIVEIVEEVEEEESSSEEEEIIIRRVIKKVPKKRVEQNTDELCNLSNQDLLKRKLFESTRKRLMSDLFS